MKSKINLIITVLFYAGGVYSLFVTEPSGILALYLTEAPYISSLLAFYVMIALYGSAAILALSLFAGVKPSNKIAYYITLGALIATYGYEIYEMILSKITNGEVSEMATILFMVLGLVFPLYLLIKLVAGKEK